MMTTVSEDDLYVPGLPSGRKSEWCQGACTDYGHGDDEESDLELSWYYPVRPGGTSMGVGLGDSRPGQLDLQRLGVGRDFRAYWSDRDSHLDRPEDSGHVRGLYQRSHRCGSVESKDRSCSGSSVDLACKTELTMKFISYWDAPG